MAIKKKIVPYEGVIEGSFEWYTGKINEMTNLTICENYIRTSATAFILMGQAFKRIRDNRLYERDWKGTNFETYCRDQWNLGRWQVNNIIRASTAALMWIKHKGDSEVSKLSPTVWGLVGRYLMNENELVETAGELIASYEEGISKAQAQEILRKKEAKKAENEEARLRSIASEKETDEMKETKKSLEKYETAHEMEKIFGKMEKEWERMEKDNTAQTINEADLSSYKEALVQNWNQLLKKFGHIFPGHLMIEIALKFFVLKHEELEKKMRAWEHREESGHPSSEPKLG
jgi:hypothetical protein